MNNILSNQKKFTIVFWKTTLKFCCQPRKTPWQVSQKTCWVYLYDRKHRKSLKPVGSRQGVTYRSCKIHKASLEKCLPFRSVLSALNTPTYKLAKFLVLILKPFTTNEFTVKDYFILLKKSLIKILISLWVVWM